MRQAHIQAKTLFDMIVITRQWVAENRDEIKPVPAVATKQLSKYANKFADFRFHITSDNLVNPENKPDTFEKYALKEFKKGVKEVYRIEITSENQLVYRYMAPLYINKSCLNCHQYQGYKVGDLRGGISVYVPIDNMINTLRQNQKTTIFLVITAYFLLNFVLIILLRKTVLKPIKILETGTKAIENKDFSHKIIINTNDEFSQLAKAFNIMIEKISEHEKDLKTKIKQAVGQYTITVEQLKETNENLKKLANFKSDIIDSLAHEIRTPLTKIVSCIEILQSDNSIKQNKCIEILSRNSLILKELFDKILLLNKLEYSKYEFNFSEIDMESLIKYILSKFMLEIETKNININYNIKEKKIICDPTLIEILISNLISNAVKYNVENGEIFIDIYSDDKNYIIKVKDTGIGIDENEKKEIFKRFYRSSSVKKLYSGTGLGLSLVKRILDNLNGRIEILSEKNKYTEFIIYLPKKK
ncbi:DUF3365 domain-containing protein [Deferribacter thermophilus]|uniref:ATP-binding protein n=1 Tax=Deferribacter thermophilus TaxID=53573 RepID=UPI003C1C751B